MDLSIIIVNYNSTEALTNCLYSIKQHISDISYETIVIDNASQDNSIRILKDGRKNIGFFHVCRDITHRKQMERSLRESEETARALLNATTDSAMLVDAERTVLDLNKPFADLLGRSVNDLIGRKIWEILPAGVYKKSGAIPKVIQTGKPIRLEREYQGRWTDNIIYPVMDSEKKSNPCRHLFP